MIKVPPLKKSLNDRLKDLTTSSRVKLGEVVERKKKEKKKEEIVDIRELIPDQVIRIRVLRLARQIREFNIQESEIKRAKSQHVDALKFLLTEHDIDEAKFIVDKMRVSAYYVPRSTIVADKLLAHNVSPKTIRECTETTKSLHLKISEVGEDPE